MENEVVENKLEAIMAKQPYQGEFSSFSKLEKANVEHKKILRAFTKEFPSYPSKITFSIRCVPCVGQTTIGGCIECTNFDGDKSKEDLFKMEILKQKNMDIDKLLVFDITYVSKESKEDVFQVVLATDSDSAKRILELNKSVSKIIECANLGKPLIQK